MNCPSAGSGHCPTCEAEWPAALRKPFKVVLAECATCYREKLRRKEAFRRWELTFKEARAQRDLARIAATPEAEREAEALRDMELWGGGHPMEKALAKGGRHD